MSAPRSFNKVSTGKDAVDPPYCASQACFTVVWSSVRTATVLHIKVVYRSLGVRLHLWERKIFVGTEGAV